jgi:outer membrane protein assembly factor BamB
MKTDLLGNTEWNVTSGGTTVSRGHSIISNQHGELTIAGVRQHEETERLDAFVLHTTSDGSQVWNLTLGEELDEVANALIACSDGGYAIAGEVSQSDESPWHDMLVVRLNDYGQVLWQKAYGEEGNDIGISLVECSDGDFVLAGTTSSFGFLSGTAWLTRVPDAPPPIVDPQQVDLPTALLGMTLALIVLGVTAAIYLRSRREIKGRIRQCS